MKKPLLSLFIAFCVLIAPIAHAAGCAGDGCQVVDTAKKVSKGEQQDHDKTEKTAHHCCCSYILVKIDIRGAEPESVNGQSSFAVEDERIGTLVLGPPLKPPSHA